jgi:hypothetical protein
MLDADATKGATLGKDLKDEDGNIITLESIVTNVTVTDPRQVFPTLWELILNIPTIIKSLAALTATGIMHHMGSGVITAHYWPTIKNSLAIGEEFTVPADNQMLVWKSMDVAGSLNVEGRMVVLGDNDTGLVRDVIPATEAFLIPENHQLVVVEGFTPLGDVDVEGTLAIL